MDKTYVMIIITEYPNCGQLKETYKMLGELNELNIPLTIARCSSVLAHKLSERAAVRHMEYLIECPDPLALPTSQDMLYFPTTGVFLPDAWYELKNLEQAVNTISASGFNVCIASDDPVVKKLRYDGIEPHLCVPHASILYSHNLALLFHSYEWLCFIIQMRRTQRGEDVASCLIEGQQRWRNDCNDTAIDSYIVIAIPALHLSSRDDFENFFKPFFRTLQKESVVTTVGGLLNHFPKQDATQFFSELQGKPYRIALSIKQNTA